MLSEPAQSSCFRLGTQARVLQADAEPAMREMMASFREELTNNGFHEVIFRISAVTHPMELQKLLFTKFVIHTAHLGFRSNHVQDSPFRTNPPLLLG